MLNTPQNFTASPDGRLTATLQAIRRQLPLPLERIRQPDPDALSDLHEKVAKAADRTTLRQLAGELDSNEIALLFPLLVQTGTTAKLTRRITLLITERACPTLYRYGWLTWQHHYPSAPAAVALTALCRELAGRPAATPSRNMADSSLISEIVAPNDRQFIRSLIERLILIGLSLDAFVRQYQLDVSSPLGQAVVAAYFLDENAPAYVYRQNGAYFSQYLSQAGLGRQATLLAHFLNRTAIDPEERNQFCQLIYRQIGSPAPIGSYRTAPGLFPGKIPPGREPALPAPPHAVWSKLSARDVRIFLDWVNAATIGSHCRERPDKARLYLQYADRIVRLETWETDTLLLIFPGFLIADSRRQPDLALCYELAGQPGAQPPGFTRSQHALGPAYAAIPHRQIEDALRNLNFQGIIGLPFDPQGIRLTRTFFSLRLKAESASPGRRSPARR